MKKSTRLLIGGAALLVVGSFFLSGVSLKGSKIEYKLTDSLNYDRDVFYMNSKSPLVAADPWVIQVDDAYYAYATSDKLSGYGFLAWKSYDMVEWKEVGTVYYTSKDTWGKRDFWAPEVTYYEGQYYLHYTAKEQSGAIKIGMAVSESPEGPFKDIENVPFFDPGYNVIDSNIFVDDDGKTYFYYTRDCSEYVYNGHHESHIYGVEIKDMKEIIGEPVLLTQPTLEWELQSGDWRWNEGPEVLKHDEKYYLIYSGNFYNSREYSLGYAVSDSPLGPFEKVENNQILYVEEEWSHVSGPGHNSFAPSKDLSETYAIYHSHINPYGGGIRQLNIDPIGFRNDGTMYINGPSVSPQPLPSGNSKVMKVNKYIDSIAVNNNIVDHSVLFDNEIVYHQEQLHNALQLKGKNEITITFNKEINIENILLYGYETTKNPFKVAGIQLNENSHIKGEKATNQLPGEAAIYSFDSLKTNEITIIVEGNKPFYLSEIIILGQN